MLMYGVSERLILMTWSLETLVMKVRHGIDFELLKRGVVPEEKREERRMSDAEITRLYG